MQVNYKFRNQWTLNVLNALTKEEYLLKFILSKALWLPKYIVKNRFLFFFFKENIIYFPHLIKTKDVLKPAAWLVITFALNLKFLLFLETHNPNKETNNK